jgi:O-antigen/teichoic acid export membrane protein
LQQVLEDIFFINADQMILNRTKIAGSIATLFSGSVVAQGMTAFALLLTARQLKVDGYGQYAACITLTSMLSIIFSLGLDVWLLREGGRTPSRIAELASSVLSIKASLGLLWIFVFWLLASLLNQQSFPISLLRLCIILTWSDMLLWTGLNVFKAALHNQYPSIIEASADAIWLGCTLLLIYYGIHQPEAYIGIRLLISILALSVTLLMLLKRFGWHYDFQLTLRAIKESFPFSSSEFLSMITMRADVVIISVALGATATGLYSPAVGLVNMAFLVPAAIHIVMVPVLSNLYLNHPQQAKKTAFRTVVLSLLIGIGLTLFFYFGSPLIIPLLGPSYTGSVAILQILSWLLLFKSGSFAMAAILVATDQQIRRTSIQVIAAITNIVLNLLIVFWLGVKGVALVYVITEVILFIGYTWFVVRKK